MIKLQQFGVSFRNEAVTGIGVPNVVYNYNSIQFNQARECNNDMNICTHRNTFICTCVYVCVYHKTEGKGEMTRALRMRLSGRTQCLLSPLSWFTCSYSFSWLTCSYSSVGELCASVPLGSAPYFSLCLIFNRVSMNINQVISGN